MSIFNSDIAADILTGTMIVFLEQCNVSLRLRNLRSILPLVPRMRLSAGNVATFLPPIAAD